MTKQETEVLVQQLLEKHGAVDYKFSWMKPRMKFNRAGQCNWKKKLIQLQPVYVEKNDIETVTNTILHEIAHALTPNHGHNKFWKRKAIEIGCNGKRQYGKEVKR